MHAGDPYDADRAAAHASGGDLRGLLSEREARIARLEEMVERNLSMLDRYDSLAAKLSQPGSSAMTQDRHIGQALERALELLEQATARAERLTRENHSLESGLDRALMLLERSLDNQEAMASRAGTGAQAAGPGAAQGMLDETIARYDRMMERSLKALEDAYRASQDSRKEIDARDKLLTRTLDALENAVGGEGRSERPGLFGRLFS